MAKTVASIKIEGMGELKQQLSRFKGEERKKVLYDVLDAGGRIVETYAKINVNERFSSKQRGHLAGSIQARTKVTAKGGESSIGPEGVIYARIHELGGIIVPRNAKALHWTDEHGNDIFAKKVVMPARPYLRPALDENVEEITMAMDITLKNHLLRQFGEQ